MAEPQVPDQVSNAVPQVLSGVNLRKLRIGPEEAFVFSRIDGRASIKEIALATGLEPFRVASAIQTLVAQGALRPIKGLPKSPPTRTNGVGRSSKSGEQAPERASRTGTSGTGSPLSEQELTRRVDAMLLRLEREDYYQLLGVARDADRQAIKTAYFEVITHYHPDKYYGQLGGELKPRVERVFQSLTTAHETLTRAKKRAEYDATLGAGTRGQPPQGKFEPAAAKQDPPPRKPEPAAAKLDPPARRPEPKPAPAPAALAEPSPAGAQRAAPRPPEQKRAQEPPRIPRAGSEGIAKPDALARHQAPVPRDVPRANVASDPPRSGGKTVPAADSPAAREAAARMMAMLRRDPVSDVPASSPGGAPTVRPDPTVGPTERPPREVQIAVAQELAAGARPTLRPSMAPPEPAELRVSRYVADAEEHLRKGNAVAASNSLRLAASLAGDGGRSVTRIAELERQVDAMLFDSNLQNARRHELAREWASAGRYYGKAAKSQDSGDLYIQAARCFRQGGRGPDAEQHAALAVRARPNDPTAHELLGQIYAEAGKIVSAIASLEKARSLNPRDDAIKTQIDRLRRGTRDA